MITCASKWWLGVGAGCFIATVMCQIWALVIINAYVFIIVTFTISCISVVLFCLSHCETKHYLWNIKAKQKNCMILVWTCNGRTWNSTHFLGDTYKYRILASSHSQNLNTFQFPPRTHQHHNIRCQHHDSLKFVPFNQFYKFSLITSYFSAKLTSHYNGFVVEP